MSGNGSSGNFDPKIISIICYITIFGWIVALVMNKPKSSLASFHLRQMLGLILISTGLSILSNISLFSQITWILGIGILVLWLLGLISAINGETKPIPVVGEYFQEWFKSL